MSGGFENFTEAARLYAKYASVVEEMRELFGANISAFLDAVRDRMRSQVKDGCKLGEWRSDKYVNWWIEDAESDDDCPYVWIESQLPEIVEPGILKLIATAGSTRDRNQQFATVRETLRLPASCEITKGGGLFTIKISYNTDPVTNTAQPTLAVLTALYDADLNLRETAKRARTPKPKE